jgi:hypothetical protein
MKPTIAAHQALPTVGLHGLALAAYPPRRWAATQLCIKCTRQQKEIKNEQQLLSRTSAQV